MAGVSGDEEETLIPSSGIGGADGCGGATELQGNACAHDGCRGLQMLFFRHPHGGVCLSR